MTITIDVAKLSQMTGRDYAVSLGLAKPARGKMSAEAYAAIAYAESQGVTFKPTASAAIRADIEARRAAGEVIKRGRKPSGTAKKTVLKPVTERKKRVLTEEHKEALRRGREKARQEAAGAVLPLEEHEKGNSYSDEWYDRVFQVGNFVCMPDGRTLKVTQRKDESGWTHFVDRHDVSCKAKVNGMWGVRKGWPDGGASAASDNDDA